MRLYHSLLFLPLASSVYSWTIDSSCAGRDEVGQWMEEAIILFSRASAVLQEALSMPIMAGNIKEILDAVLGTNAGITQYEQVLENFQKIHEQANDADVHILCSDPIMESTGEFVPGTTETQTVYPVSLGRVGADPRIYLQGQQIEPWWYGGQDFFVIVSKSSTSLAYTVSSEHPSIMQSQVLSTGSHKLWSDIICRDILDENAPANFYPEYSNDWSLQGMSGRNLFDPPHPGSVTIMHELMHTHLAPDTCRSHGEVNINGISYHANGLYSVLLLGSGNTDAPLGNPDSYAWLAILLSMPWYKWWDRTTTPPLLDGFIRYNLFEYDTGSGVAEFMYIPQVLRTSMDNLGSDEEEELKSGPHAIWNN